MDTATITVNIDGNVIELTCQQARILVREINRELSVPISYTKKLTQKEFRLLLGENIRRERKKLRLQAKRLAKQAGLSIGFFSNVETGQTGISAINLASVARALGCSIEDLLQNNAADHDAKDVS